MKAFVGGNKKVIASSYLNCDQLNKKSFASYLPLVHQALLQQKHYYIMDCNRILSCSKGKYILDGQLYQMILCFV